MTLPAVVLDSHVGIMGKTGSGKSNLAKVVAEGLLDAGSRVCVFDPTGTWYGLRLTRAGKPSKYSVVMFGGEHGDLPLGKSHGVEIAATIGTTATPAILDLRRMTVGERTTFAADFAETLLQRNRGELHLIVDEAHLFAPKGKVQSVEAGRMLGAWNNLVSLGRGVGLRIILISQRPAKLHNDSLTQIETLIAMRLVAPWDRDAIGDWIKEVADPAQGKEVLASLAKLPTGEGWVWSPLADILERQRFPLAATMDTGKPSDLSITLGPINVDDVRARLEKAGVDVQADDPKALRKRIAELERQIATMPTQSVEIQKIVEKNVIGHDDIAALEAALDGLKAYAVEIGDVAEVLRADLALAIADRPKTNGAPIQASQPVTMPPAKPAPRAVAPAERPSEGSYSLGKAEIAFLSALAQYPDGMTRSKLALLTGYRPTSGHISNTLTGLRQKGLIHPGPEPYRITADGMAAAPATMPLPSPGPDLVAHYLSTLGGAEAAFLKTIVDVYPDAISGAEIAERNGYRPTSGHVSNTLSSLRIRGLITGPANGVRASQELVG